MLCENMTIDELIAECGLSRNPILLEIYKRLGPNITASGGALNFSSCVGHVIAKVIEREEKIIFIFDGGHYLVIDFDAYDDTAFVHNGRDLSTAEKYQNGLMSDSERAAYETDQKNKEIVRMAVRLEEAKRTVSELTEKLGKVEHQEGGCHGK